MGTGRGVLGIIRIIENQREGDSPPPNPLPPPLPDQREPDQRKNEIYKRENLVGPFLVPQLLGPRPSPAHKTPWDRVTTWAVPPARPALPGNPHTAHPSPLSIGALVYARVIGASKDMDPEISCCSSVAQQRKDWVTGLGVYGELLEGYCFSVSSTMARRLHREDSDVLLSLGALVPFESAVGVNGKVWIRSPNPTLTVVLVNCIQRAESMPAEQFRQLVQETLPYVSR